MNEIFEPCQQCEHYNENQSEYHYCHVCVMEYDCFKQKAEEKENTLNERQIEPLKKARDVYEFIIEQRRENLFCDACGCEVYEDETYCKCCGQKINLDK